MSWCILVWNNITWTIKCWQRFLIESKKRFKNEYYVRSDIRILIYCIDLIEGIKDSLSTFRDNSKGDFDKIVKVTDDLMVKNEIYDWDVSYQFPKQKTASKVCWTRMLHLKWEKQPRLGTTCVYRHNGTRYWTSNLWNSVVFRTSHTG